MLESRDNSVELLPKVLKEVFEEDRTLDQVCSFWIRKNSHWSSYDKGNFVETLAEIVRWWRLLSTIVSKVFGANCQEQYRLIVLVYLFLYKEDDAYVSKFFSNSIKKSIKSNFDEIKNNRAIINSIPDWLDKVGYNELGDRWTNEIEALNTLPKTVIRVNSLKTTKDILVTKLKNEGFKLSNEELPYGLIIRNRNDLYNSKSFKDGLFEQQDASSQMVAPFLQVEPGMRVIDACAGNGGKSLHLACLMQNRGRILALDVADWKLEELKRRAARAGASIVESRVISTTKVIKRLKDSADRLLLDVPCSGLGVLRRNPDSKWRLSPEKLEELKRTQTQILDKYTQMLKPGGKLVYSTCSILPSENQSQIQLFLESSKGAFTLEEERTISPVQSGFDGFYMARLRKVI